MSHAIGVGGIEIDEAGKRYVNDVLDSNELSYGKYCRRFESEFAEAHDSGHAVLANSGTGALRVAVAALKEKYGWADGDEVLVPALTFVASVNVILGNNLEPVLVDCDPVYYGMDPAKIEEKVTSRTRCIMVVHLFGQPCDMEPIWEIAKRHDLRIIEDSCETMFASYQGRKVGSLGDIGCFSTYIAHILVTGVGGLSTTSDPDLAMLMRSYVNHGRNNIYIARDDDVTDDQEKRKEIIAKRFQFERVGYSFRVTEMEAALGVAQMEKRDENIARRRRIADRYISGLQAYGHLLQLPLTRPGNDHVFMMFPIVIRPNATFSKKELVEHLEEHGVETRAMVPLTNQPVYHKMWGSDLEDRYPVAKWINQNGFYIGCHPYITDDNIATVLAAFKTFFEAKGL